MTRYTFGENLKYYRTKKGISQIRLAKILRVSSVSICYWESGTRYPRIDMVYDIARALGIDVTLLVETHD